MVKFLGADEKIEISSFIGLFCLKDKLLGQKTETAVSSPDTAELWNVLAKSESRFPVQPTTKWSSFLEQARSLKIQIPLVCSVKKINCLDSSFTAVSSPDTEGL